MPGPCKWHDGLERLFLDAVEGLSVQLGTNVTVRMTDAAGYYTLARSPLGPEACKRVSVALEERHCWNRLLDIDCFSADGRAITRQSLGVPERRCLVCDNPHAACIQAKRHPIEQVTHAAIRLIEAYGRVAEKKHIKYLSIENIRGMD